MSNPSSFQSMLGTRICQLHRVMVADALGNGEWPGTLVVECGGDRYFQLTARQNHLAVRSIDGLREVELDGETGTQCRIDLARIELPEEISSGMQVDRITLYWASFDGAQFIVGVVVSDVQSGARLTLLVEADELRLINHTNFQRFVEESLDPLQVTVLESADT